MAEPTEIAGSSVPAAKSPRPGLHVFLVAVEESGDRLGAALMRSLSELSAAVRFSGVGGAEMRAAGLDSLHPIDDFSIIGFMAIPGAASQDSAASERHRKRRPRGPA